MFGIHPSLGCTNDDCTYTDKFPVSDYAECGLACSKTLDCRYWVFGQEEGMNKCWMRLSDMSREQRVGFVSGSATCGSTAPVKPNHWTDGNNKCWGGGFTAELCCDQKFGKDGNPACWDSYHTFQTCCLGKEPKADVYEVEA